MDTTTFALLAVTILIGVGILIIMIGFRFSQANEVQKRIQSFVIDSQDNMRSPVTDLQNREFTESLLQRTLASWVGSVLNFLGRYTPYQSVNEINRRLTIAGNPYGFRAHQYYGFRLLFMLFGTAIAIIVYQINPSVNFLLVAVTILALFSLAPGIWLSIIMRRRQDIIRRNLPDALDMLSVCTSAGLSFDQSMLRLGQSFKTPVGMEFARVVSEIEVGISRQQALRNMQARVDISELSSFVAVILQSELLGMSIADVLHAQAEQMRIHRQYRAKEIAQQLPAKMMIPLVLFIFPALFAVLLGPMVPAFMEIFK